MALESATYISDLNTANPAPTDLIGQGDDHIRLIKSVLKTTFPNINGAVTLTEEDLNGIVALLSSGGVPVGAITAWYGASIDIPIGWHVCDGSTVARSDASGTITVPDLRNLVIMGAGTVAAQGTAFGGATQTATSASSGAHSHATTAGGGGHVHSGVTVSGHALSISEIPAHTHTFSVSDQDSSSGSNPDGTTNTTASGTVTTSSTGGGAAHTHGMSWPATPDGTHTHATDAAAAHTHGVTVSVYQPALSLHYIMKV